MQAPPITPVVADVPAIPATTPPPITTTPASSNGSAKRSPTSGDGYAYTFGARRAGDTSDDSAAVRGSSAKRSPTTGG